MTATAGRESRFQPAGGGGGAAGRPTGGAFGRTAAVAPEPEETVTDKKKAKGSKKKKIIIAVVVVLVVGLAAYKFLKPKPPYKPSGGDVVALDSQTLNLSDGHYLKVSISVQLLKGKAKAASFDISQADQLTINEFSDRTVDSLASLTLRKAAEADLLTQLKKAYPNEIYNIFITQFVTQ